MIDLTQRKTKNLYPIKWIDGDVIHLLPPTQSEFMGFIKISEKNDSTSTDEIEIIISSVHNILSKNAENKVITYEEYQAEIPFTVAIEILGDYMNFYHSELGKSKSLTTPKTKKKA